MTPEFPHTEAPRAQILRRVIVVALLSAAIASLLLAVPGLRGVATQLTHLEGAWVFVAVALELGSCLAFVVIFRLFFDGLTRGTASELAWTEQGAGALLPGGGVGALAIGGWLLRRQGISRQQVIERSSALFFLTSAVNVAALVGAGAMLALGVGPGPHDPLHADVPILGGLAVTTVVLVVSGVAHRAPRSGPHTGWMVDLVAGIDGARRSLLRPSWRLIGALGYLGLDIAALGATFAATGHPLPIAPLVLGYMIGYLANLIPIPGGFGVLEGGLAGTLIAYGAPATQAAAAVIVYHAVAFWIPSLGGLLGYALLRRRLSRQEVRSTQPRLAQPADSLPSVTRNRSENPHSAVNDRRSVNTMAASHRRAVVATADRFEVVGGHGRRNGCCEQDGNRAVALAAAHACRPGQLHVPASFPPLDGQSLSRSPDTACERPCSEGAPGVGG